MKLSPEVKGPVVVSIGRRHMYSRFAVATLLVGLVASCSSNATSEDTPETTPDTGEGVTSYPLDLQTPYGTSTLDDAPERIVTLGWGDETDALLALGIVPVASPLSSSEYEWVTPITPELTEIDAYDLDFERILSLEPDLIVNLTDDISADYERLTQIAPVLTYPDEPATIRDWRESLQLIGDTVDRPSRADELIDQVDDKLDSTKTEHPEFAGKTLTYAMDYGAETGVWYLTFDGSAPQTLFESLGFTSPPPAADFSEGAQTVSPERLDLLDSNVILTGVARSGSFETFETSGIFRALPGVRDGGYAPLVETDVLAPISWSLRSPSVLNVPWVLDKIIPTLQEAAAGNGKAIA